VTKPPSTIDGATVVRVAYLTPAIVSGRTRHIVDGVERRDFAALAIARYASEASVYLFYCDADWKALTDTSHANIKLAIAQAEFEFGPLEFVEMESE
jgi:hypothetical protein